MILYEFLRKVLVYYTMLVCEIEFTTPLLILGGGEDWKGQLAPPPPPQYRHLMSRISTNS